MHVAIIPDGNRRWAKKRGLPTAVGHMKGAQNFERIIQAALDMGIKNLTIWGGSFDNLTKRKKSEISALLKIYDKYFTVVLKSEKIIENKAVNFNEVFIVIILKYYSCLGGSMVC